MSAQPGELRFVPWLRTGLAATDSETPGAGKDQRRKVALAVSVERVGVQGAPTSESVPMPARLHGPGDVVQINPAQVIATDPKPFANDFEPNYLAAVAFDAPEFPALFSLDASPPETDLAGRLRPWICLVVVRREAARIVADPNRPVPTLVLEEAAGELPDLAESWAWAHAQIAGPASVDDALAGPPERTLSRLICPRRLEPSTAYLACVVPTFAAGRQAGVGQAVTAGTEPAWTSPAAGPIELPVYYSWEFATGAAGDFESLVRRLLPPTPLGPGVGLRDMDVSNPGPGLPVLDSGAPGSVLGLEGALRSIGMLPSEWPDGPRAEFQGRLEAMLEAPQGDAATVVTPPTYGGVQADAVSIAQASQPPAWLRELNLDPRHRAAAALGTRVVQEQQEQLMASAWDQAGEIARANQLLRQGQLARAVAGSLREKRLDQMPPATLLRLTEPVHARIQAPEAAPVADGRSLLGSVRASVFPEAAVSPPFRRALRPRGPLGRRIGQEPVTNLVGGLARGEVLMPIEEVISGTVEHDQVDPEKTLDQVTEGVPDAEGWRIVGDFREILGESPPPHIDNVAPERETPGDEVRITGFRFRTRTGESAVRFVLRAPGFPSVEAEVVSWEDRGIRALVPAISALGAAGPATVTVVNRIGEYSVEFTVLEESPPEIAGLSHEEGPPEEELRISGERFGVSGTDEYVVTFGDQTADILSWTPEEILVRVPDPAAHGGPGEKPLVVRTPWGESDPATFTITEPPAEPTPEEPLTDEPVAAAGQIATAASALRRADGDLPDDVGYPDRPDYRLFRLRLGGINARFRAAAEELQGHLEEEPPPGVVPAGLAPLDGDALRLPLPEIRTQLVARDGRLDPELTLPRAVLPLVELPDGARPEGADELAPARVAPRFPQPMYEHLVALSQDHLLPGVDQIPPDTVGLLAGNPRFIEAYMVGLNDELGREFLWRGLPANPRATFFEQFWDVRGRDPSAAGPPTDIPPIADWDSASGLGTNATGVGGHGMLILLIRGELMRRYPTATVYAVKAAGRTQLGAQERYPAFRGNLDPDLTFFAFDLSEAEVRGTEDGDPGWFFVIQEQATEPRFGLDAVPDDEPRYGGMPSSWRDLHWGHLVENEEELQALSHVPAGGRLANLELDGLKWGLNSVHVAAITLQRPARVAIHASAMLPPATPAPTPVTAVRREGGRISAIGGIDAFGGPWRMGEEEAMVAIRVGTHGFFVDRPAGDSAEVVISSREGRDYLKTAADGERPNNLLDLPEL